MARFASVVEPLVADVALGPLDPGDDGPGAVVVRHHAPPERPGGDEDGEAVGRLLVQQVGADAHRLVGAVVPRFQPAFVQCQAPGQRPQALEDFALVAGFGGDPPKILNILLQ